jgi:hypothetical protein
MDVDAVRHHPANVVKNPLDKTPVYITRRMHVKAHLVDSVGDIRSCEHQVLQGADDTMVECSITLQETAKSTRIQITYKSPLVSYVIYEGQCKRS